MIPFALAAALALAAPAPAPPAAPAPPPSAPAPRPSTLCSDSACRAVAASGAGRFADSAEQFEAAASTAPPASPLAARALAAAGNMWIAAGQPGKAAVALDRALAGNGLQVGDRGEALLDRARAAEAQNDLKTARARLTEAAQTIGGDPFLWYFSAALAVRESDLPRARIAINRALTIAPGSPEILFEAGHVAAAFDNVGEARDYWQRALAADPRGPTGAAARHALATTVVPLTVTGKVAQKPDGDGDGAK